MPTLVGVVGISRGRGGHDGAPELGQDECPDCEQDILQSQSAGVLLIGSDCGEARDVEQPKRLVREQVLEAIDGVADQGVLL